MKLNILFFIGMIYLCSACQKDEISNYNSGRYLFFANYESVDSTVISFSHYPLESKFKLEFEVLLTGDLLSQPTELELAVVDSLTTAAPENYDIDFHPQFPANVVKNSIYVTLVNSEALKTKNVTLVLQIKDNQNFSQGIYGRRKIKIVFNDIQSKPLWWDANMQNIYLGTYSPKKFEQFVICTKVNDLTGMDPSLVRRYALKFKAEIERLGLTEADGSPMVVPVY